MGVLDRVFRRINTAGNLAVSLPTTSPYSPAPQLPQMVITDLFPEGELNKLPLTRENAISIPAVSKARNLLVATIAKFPLRAIRVDANGNETDVTSDHAWLYRTNSTVSPYERLAWTVDSLFFYGCAVWLTDRGAPDKEGRRPILSAEWCPPAAWQIKEIDGELRLHVDGVPIADDRFILINSPFEGLLNVGQSTLRGARDVERAWVGRARNPIPMVELHVTDDALDPDEVKLFVDSWALARTGENGAIGYTPPGLEVRTHGEVKAELMVEGRNAIRTDVGSFTNIRVAMLDGTIGVDSLTYTTKDGERNSFYEFDLPFWTDPITARLSLDDVVPRGTRIRFDMYEAYNPPTPTGAPVED